jgi:hypothetical protein
MSVEGVPMTEGITVVKCDKCKKRFAYYENRKLLCSTCIQGAKIK